MKLQIVFNQTRNSVRQKWFTARFNKALEHLRKCRLSRAARIHLQRSKSLTVVFVSEKLQKELNFKYRGQNKSTDILSFAPIEKDSLGELSVCLPVIKKQKKRFQMSEDELLVYLLIHGVLHLLGYDHEQNTKDAQRMYAIQDTVFKKLL